MLNKSIEAITARLAEFEAQEQTRFITELGEKHGLAAAALKTIDKVFKHGSEVGTALGVALAEYNEALGEVQLAETDERPQLPAAITNIDFSDTILLSRTALREAFEIVAGGERTEIKLGDTTIVEGAPARGDKKFVTQLNEMTDPRAAAAALDAAHAAGTI